MASTKQTERPIGADLAFDNRVLRQRLQALGEPAEMPHVDELTILRYLENMVSAGLIGRPEQRLSAA